MRSFLSSAFVAAFFIVTPLFAQPDPQPKPEKEAWIVVQTAKEGFQVMEADELKDFKKKSEADYKEALAAWTKAKAAAKKEKREFDEPKPEKPMAKKAAGPFKSEEEAINAKNKILEKINKKKKKDGDDPDEN